MRLLVLGGTRFLSRAVAEHAVEAGHEVTSACRGTDRLADGVRHLPLDREGGSAAGLTDAFDAVVDVARTPSWVRAAVAAVPAAHWVYVSSISAYADHATPDGGPQVLRLLDPIEEDRDPAESPETYGGMKVACERTVQAGASSATVVRPGLVVGPGDPTGRFTYWPVRLSGGGRVLAPGDPADLVQVVDVRDLAAFLVLCAEQQTVATLDAIGPPLPREEFLRTIAAAVGGDASLEWRDDAWLAGRGVEPWAGQRSLPLWLPGPEYAGMLCHDPGPAADAGLRVRPLAETAVDTLEWWRSAGDAPLTGLTRGEESELLAS